MAKFELNTTFQFPFFKITELVKYTEVKKPSGVAYMLLVLINESKDKKANLSLTLENFGIPKNLHFIYKNALIELVKQGIIEEKHYKDLFDEYLIGDFNFTAKGKKIFQEESIPTGVIKESKVSLWYDIAMNSFSDGLLKPDMEAKPLMESAITPVFMEQFKIKKDVEALLNIKKGSTLKVYDDNSKHIDDVTIKKEEVITEVEELSKTNWLAKYDCSIKINDDNLEFKFDEDALKKFFDEYYSSEIIDKFISFKSKFKFESSFANGLKLSDFNDFEIAQVLIPKDISSELKKKNKLLITKGNYQNKEILMILSGDGLDKISKSCEFVMVSQDNDIYAYIPGVFNFDNKIFGNIHIPLTLKLKITIDKLQSIVIPYLKTKKEYSEENFKEVVRLTNITKDTKSACEILNGYMSDKSEDNLVILNEIKDSAISNLAILQLYKSLLSKNYHAYIKEINENKLPTFLKITHSIPKFIGLSNGDVLKEMFENLGDIISSLSIYEDLTEAGFDKSNVVLYANPIPEILSGETSTDKSINDFINYRNCIEQMKSITGIVDVSNYVIDLEKIDKKVFKQHYSTAYSLSKQVEIFRACNKETFSSLDSFIPIFKNINDDFNMQDEALKNPNKVSQELIERKIIEGDYQFVFVNLAAKLESILKNKFMLDGPLWEKLAAARKDKLIDENIVSDLFEFKNNRNAYIHPEDRKANFQPDDVRRWSKEIFELSKEVKK